MNGLTIINSKLRTIKQLPGCICFIFVDRLIIHWVKPET